MFFALKKICVLFPEPVHENLVVVRHIVVSLHLLFSIVYRIDHRSMILPTKVIPYFLKGPSEIFLGQEHEDLPRDGYLFPSRFGFEFIDSDIVILSDHIHQIGKILDAFGVGLDSLLCRVHLLF